MRSLQSMLVAFHVKFGHWIGQLNGQVPPAEVLTLRHALIGEEAIETLDALAILRRYYLSIKCPGIVLDTKNHTDESSFSGCTGGADCPTCAGLTGTALHDRLRTEVLDGIADSVYVLVGTAVSLGFDFHRAFEEVHRSNMSKTAPENPDPTAKYSVKTPKGPNYSPPNLQPCIWSGILSEADYEQVSRSISEAPSGDHHRSAEAGG